ncbi:hypothetical protein ROE7235_00445 [Roseibaca ekhonensis]|uniref:YicC family protein n=1 Tax=Roseinatronobacter ekhonensis TaxID=254356 RepID=A0A3B0MM40_9RHOB|nr:YicC/YloC family endoribonuclease [Roseibaca ekhonensis]SUZ30719.1 hypothetical protein ROE7235_00445 [Roseibaca ekhonensis]
MLNSMTGFASQRGEALLDQTRTLWDWELRAVNGRGLDLRLRLPEGFGFLEKPLRGKLVARVARGNVTLSLRLRHMRPEGAAQVDQAALQDLLSSLAQLHAQAADAGVALSQPTTLELLNARGAQATGHDVATFDTAELGKLLLADIETLLARFADTRAQEGAALGAILSDQLDQIAALVAQAREGLPDRDRAMQVQFRSILARFTEADQIDPGRLEQELAMQAVKADIAEELDRLDAHCASARAHLAQGGPVGRKLEFLTQEFNREANTLCAKAQHMELTRLGLALKSVIDQLREQVQNLE